MGIQCVFLLSDFIDFEVDKCGKKFSRQKGTDKNEYAMYYEESIIRTIFTLLNIKQLMVDDW